MTAQAPDALVPTAAPAPGGFDAMPRGTRPHAEGLIGPVSTRPLVIPVHDDAGTVIGGLWGTTAFQWLHVQLLFIPADRRGDGLGTALLRGAEAEARTRGCVGAHVSTLCRQAGPFYEKQGYTLFGTLRDHPPGHDLLHFRKRLDQPDPGQRQAIAGLLDQKFARARHLAAHGRIAAAKRMYVEITRLDPTNEAALTEMGDLAWSMGEPDAARAAWLKAMHQRLGTKSPAAEPV